MLEPEDVESFALVSKRVYSVSKPFMMEHMRLKNQFSSIVFSWATLDNRPVELLKQILRNPRITFYIRQLQVHNWGAEPVVHMISLANFEDTMAVFENAIQHSNFVTPSEVEDWIRQVRGGNEDPVLALIIMRLIKLRSLSISALCPRADDYLLRTLDRIMHFSEAGIDQEPSIAGTEADGRSQLISRRPSILFSVYHLEMNECDIDLDLLSRLLQSIPELISFDFRSNEDQDPQILQIHNELFKFSKHSLQRLVLFNNSDEQNNMLDIACFEKLTHLSTELVILLGNGNESCRSFADVLPVSIREVMLRSWEPVCNEPLRVEPLSIDLIKRLALQMVECKTKRLPNLKALTFEGSFLEVGFQEDLAKLKVQCAEAGVLLEVYYY